MAVSNEQHRPRPENPEILRIRGELTRVIDGYYQEKLTPIQLLLHDQDLLRAEHEMPGTIGQTTMQDLRAEHKQLTDRHGRTVTHIENLPKQVVRLLDTPGIPLSTPATHDTDESTYQHQLVEFFDQLLDRNIRVVHGKNNIRIETDPNRQKPSLYPIFPDFLISRAHSLSQAYEFKNGRESITLKREDW